MLKKDGYFIINIANIKIKNVKYPCADDAEKFSKILFGDIYELLVLPMNMIFGNRKIKKFECDDSGRKMEKIFVFKKK